jgi:hypothetical protein
MRTDTGNAPIPPSVTYPPTRCVRLPGSAAIAPSFIQDVCQGRLRAANFDEVARDRAMRVYLLASMYPTWTAAQCLALADEPGSWMFVNDTVEFRPTNPSFWARWEGK